MKYFLLIIGFAISIQVTAQKSEYRYFSMRFGYSQGFSGQPEFNPNKYLNTPNGEMQLTPVGSYMGFMPGFVADLTYHIDFPTDNAGIMVGLEYNNYGVASKYETVNGAFTMVEKHRINAIGIPLAIKIGPKFYKDQRYGFLGAQFNYHITMSANQKVSWLGSSSSTKLLPDEINTSTMAFFVGFNWLVLNIQFDYVPGSFFNKEYIIPTETGDNITPYATQADNMFFLKVSFHVPTNDWASSRWYKVRKFLRKFKR